MKKTIALLLGAAGLVLFSLDVSAACPVGKKDGDTWCKKGMEWKCEKCGSEYCEIITGRRCVKDDNVDPAALTPLQRLVLGSDANHAVLPRSASRPDR